MNKYLTAGAVGAFVALAVGANLATAHLGMVALPGGLTVTAGTFAAGAVLVARDAVHDIGGRGAVVACIAAGALISGGTAPALIALASALAFLVAELADWAVYAPLRRRGWGRAVLLSSSVGAPLDTIIFLWVAPFPVTVAAVAGQVFVKIALSALVVAFGRAGVAVLRDRIRAARA